jgi:hypothetical protein
MSSTTLPVHRGRLASRATVRTMLTAVALAVLTVLVVLAATGVVGDSPARPAAPASNEMPAPEWLKGYLDPQVTSGGRAGRPATAAGRTTPVNRGLR